MHRQSQALADAADNRRHHFAGGPQFRLETPHDSVNVLLEERKSDRIGTRGLDKRRKDAPHAAPFGLDRDHEARIPRRSQALEQGEVETGPQVVVGSIGEDHVQHDQRCSGPGQGLERGPQFGMRHRERIGQCADRGLVDANDDDAFRGAGLNAPQGPDLRIEDSGVDARGNRGQYRESGRCQAGRKGQS